LTVTSRSDKREVLLGAAVRVFARKGYHTCRVGDIAEEAGVAHGLLYHYFRSKDEVLETIFRETWGVLVVETHQIEESGASLHQQLRKKKCEVYSNDMRVKISGAGLYTYPDIVAACGTR